MIIKIPFNKWVDLYASTGFSVGDQLHIQNVGDADAILLESSSQPTSEHGSLIKESEYRYNFPNNLGAWAYSKKGTNLNVELV